MSLMTLILILRILLEFLQGKALVWKEWKELVLSLIEAQDVHFSDKRRSNKKSMLKPMPNTTGQPSKMQFIHIQDRDLV